MQSYERKNGPSVDSSKLPSRFTRVLDEFSTINNELDVKISNRKIVQNVDEEFLKYRLKGAVITHTADADEKEKVQKNFPACVKALKRVRSPFLNNLFYMSSSEAKKELGKIKNSYLYRFSPRAKGCLIQCPDQSSKDVHDRPVLYSLIGLLTLPSNSSSSRPENVDVSESCSDLSADELNTIFFKINELIEKKMIFPLVGILNQGAANNGTILGTYKILIDPTMQKIIFSYFGENIFCELQEGLAPNQRFLLSLWADTVMALVGEQPGVSRLVSLIKNKILPSIDRQMINKVYDLANFSPEAMSFIQTVYHSLSNEPKRQEIIQALQNTAAPVDNIVGIFYENESLYATFTPYAYPEGITDLYARMRSIFFKLEQQDFCYHYSSMNALKLHHENISRVEKGDTSEASKQIFSLWKERLKLWGEILAFSTGSPLCSHGLFADKALVGMVIAYLGIKIDENELTTDLAKEIKGTCLKLTPSSLSS